MLSPLTATDRSSNNLHTFTRKSPENPHFPSILHQTAINLKWFIVTTRMRTKFVKFVKNGNQPSWAAVLMIIMIMPVTGRGKARECTQHFPILIDCLVRCGGQHRSSDAPVGQFHQANQPADPVPLLGYLLFPIIKLLLPIVPVSAGAAPRERETIALERECPRAWR